jgi:hypothetical protein
VLVTPSTLIDVLVEHSGDADDVGLAVAAAIAVVDRSAERVQLPGVGDEVAAPGCQR